MDNQIWILVAAVVLAALALLAAAGRKGNVDVVAKPLLTAREREALCELERAFPQFRVFPQVSMGALLQPRKGLSKSQRATTRNSFDRKVVDFVLEERATNEIFAIVEVDDRTHDQAKDRRRDAMTISAGYRTLRIPAGRKLDLSVVKLAVDEARH